MTSQAQNATPEATVRVVRESGRYHLEVDGPEERLTSARSWKRKKDAELNAAAVRLDIDSNGFDALGGDDWERTPIAKSERRQESQAPVSSQEFADWRASSGDAAHHSPADRLIVAEQSSGSFEIVFPTNRELLVHPDNFPSQEAAQEAIDRIRGATPPGAQVSTEGWRRAPRMRPERLNVTEIDGKTHIYYAGGRQFHVGPQVNADNAREVLMNLRSEVARGAQPDLRTATWTPKPRQDPNKLSIHETGDGGAQVRYRTRAGYRYRNFETPDAGARFLETARQDLDSADPSRQIDFRTWQQERTRSMPEGPRYDHDHTRVAQVAEGDFRIELRDQIANRTIVSRTSFETEAAAVDKLTKIYNSLGPQDALDTSAGGPFMDRRRLDRQLEVANAPDPAYPQDLEGKLAEMVTSNGDLGPRLEEVEASIGQYLSSLRQEPTSEQARSLLGKFYRITTLQEMKADLRRLSTEKIPEALRDTPVGRQHGERLSNLRQQIGNAPSEAKLFASISQQVAGLKIDPKAFLQDAKGGKFGKLDFPISPRMESLASRTLDRNVSLQKSLSPLIAAAEWQKRAPNRELPPQLVESLAGLARSGGTLRNLALPAVAKPVGLALGATLAAAKAVDREVQR